MNRPDALAYDPRTARMLAEDHPEYDRHDYLRPWRYFRFYMLYEPVSRRTCWLPEGYEV